MFQQGVTLKQLLENPDLLNPPKPTEQVPNPEKKLKDGGGPSTFAGQSAFLGPNIWDKTVPYTDDFNLEYMDLDEFLMENCGTEDGTAAGGVSGAGSPRGPPPQMSPPQPPRGLSLSPMHLPLGSPLSPPQQHSPAIMSPAGCKAPDSPQPLVPKQQHATPQQMSGELARYLTPSPATSQTQAQAHSSPQSPESPQPSPQQHHVMESMMQQDSCNSDDSEGYSSILNPNSLALVQVPGQEEFDPRKRIFSEDELRPQPMIKKSRKIYVADEMKDDKYWARRKKNNTAAKRSRDARRVKENQIALRAAFLEKKISDLQDSLKAALDENRQLRKQLDKYEG